MKTEFIGNYRCNPLGCGGLRLNFSWADVGSVWFCERVNSEKIRLSKKMTKKSFTSVTVKAGGATKYITVTGILNPGIYRVYRRNDNVYEVERRVDEENTPERLKMLWSRNGSRITSQGRIILDADVRKVLMNGEEEKKDAFIFEVDIRRGYKLTATPVSTESEEYKAAPIRKDYVAKYGVNYLEKLGYVKYKFIQNQSSKGSLQAPSGFTKHLGDVNNGIETSVCKDDNGNYKSFVLTKESFLCPTCGKEELWDISKKIAVHVCPRCAESLKEFKNLVPASYFHDKTAIEEGMKVVRSRIETYKGLLFAIKKANASIQE